LNLLQAQTVRYKRMPE